MLRNYHSRRRRLQIMRGYRAILVASEAMRREYLRNGFRPDRVKLVSYPVSAPSAQTLRRKQPENEQMTSWQGCPTQKPLHLLFAGRMVALKGGEILLNALPRAVAQLARPLILTLAGDGPARARWEALARTLCAHCPLLTVKFIGWLGVAEMQRVFSAADLLVVPSLWPEPFGLIGPEAGIHGVPAAAFAVGGISQWLHEGINGFLAPANPPTAVGLATAVARCLSDPLRYLELRRGARAEALKFSHEQHIARLLEIFTAVATRPEQRRETQEDRIFTQ
jgi:glycosyltransferase involved in cell wall biosynthesis